MALFDLGTLIWSVQLGLVAWLAALALFVAVNLLTGAIPLDGLLVHDRYRGSGLPERMVLLLATLAYAFYYVSSALGAPLDPAHPSLPDVPQSVLTVLVGANGLYLTGKIVDLRSKGS